MLSRGARHAPGHTVVDRTAHGDPEGGNGAGGDAIAGFHGSGGPAKAVPTLRHPAGLPLELGLVLFDKKNVSVAAFCRHSLSIVDCRIPVTLAPYIVYAGLAVQDGPGSVRRVYSHSMVSVLQHHSDTVQRGH